jgi:hypothetical protein
MESEQRQTYGESIVDETRKNPRRRRRTTAAGSQGAPSYLDQVRETNAGERQPRRQPRREGGDGQRQRRGRICRWEGRRPPHFCQADGRWGKEKMNTDDTLSKEGCAITSVAMALAYFGRDVTPADVDAQMDRHGGYSTGNDGIGNWNVAFATGAGNGPVVTQGTSYRLYSGADEEEMHSAIRESLRLNVPVIARLRYGNSDTRTQDHFALIVGRTREGYVINDPGISAGGGAEDPSLPDVVIETATRRGGLELVGADTIEISN